MTYGGNRLVCSHLEGRVGPSKCNVHCERSHIFLFLIKYLVHILLAVTARFLVSFIKTPVLHKISVLKARIHCEISLSDYFMKHSLMHTLLHLISWNPYKICKKETSTNYYKKKSHIPMFATSPCCGHWLTCFSWKAHFHRRLFFFIGYFPEIKTSSLTIEFKCSCAINKFGTGTLCRLFKYSTEHLKNIYKNT